MGKRGYDRVLMFIACTVTIVWAITIMVGTFFPSHPTPPAVNEVMVIVAGGFFTGAVASTFRKNGRGGNGTNGTDENH